MAAVVKFGACVSIRFVGYMCTVGARVGYVGYMCTVGAQMTTIKNDDNDLRLTRRQPSKLHV